MNPTRPSRQRHRRGFSLIELLISLSITGTLLAATLVALDTSFKSYKVTTEGASTHVVARMVMHRIMTMIRNGTEFAPYPDNPLDRVTVNNNPHTGTNLQFVAQENPAAGTRRIVELQRRNATGSRGPYELWYIEYNYLNGTLTSTNERPLLSGLTEATFILEYDVGPRLKRATVDLTIKPNDFQDAKMWAALDTPTIRLVSSVSPRRLDE